MNITCLRCGRVLDESEKICRICNSVKPKEDPITPVDDKGPGEERKVVGLSGVLSLLFVAAVLGAMVYGFIAELSQNGLASAVKNKPAPLIVLAIVGFLSLLGSREWLEKVGLGFIHKTLRYVLIAVAIFFALILISLIFPEFHSNGLPDNVRF